MEDRLKSLEDKLDLLLNAVAKIDERLSEWEIAMTMSNKPSDIAREVKEIRKYKKEHGAKWRDVRQADLKKRSEEFDKILNDTASKGNSMFDLMSEIIKNGRHKDN